MNIQREVEKAEKAFDEGDIDLLRKILEPLLEKNVPAAIRLNACFHDIGTSEEQCDRDYVEGMFKAAELGDRKALYCVGAMLDVGDYGVVQDKEKASRIFKQLSDSGDEHCMWIHATELIWGEGTFEQNVEKGLTLLEEAADRGSSGACITLATFYDAGSFNYPKDIETRNKYRKLALKYDETTYDPFA